MSNKFTRWWKSLQTRSGLTVLITAAVLMEVIAVTQYIFARNGIRDEVRLRAKSEMQVKNLQIHEIINSVEVAAGNMRWAMERAILHPDSIYALQRILMQNNPNIKGCFLAFVEDYFPRQGRWFEPFTGRRAGELESVQIGSASHDYLSSEWFLEGMASDSGHWSEPYLDDVGSQAMVCTYTLPIYDAAGRKVAVMGSDVSLEWLTDVFGLQETSMSTSLLVSREGRILACPDSSLVMQTTIQDATRNVSDSMIKKVNADILAGDSGHAEVYSNDGKKGYIYYSPLEGKTGWSMAVIFSDQEIYKGLRAVGFNLTILMLLGLGLLGYIMWRTWRNMHKLQAVNAEKERIGNELRIASAIQMGMLPKTFPPYPDYDEVTIYGSLMPAKEVGGDLYDFYTRDQKLFCCLGDVSGKGVPASLVMAVTRSLFRTVSAHEDDPGAIMTQINNAMSEMNESSMFVTLFIAVLDLCTGRVLYCNAGHNPPVLMSDTTRFIHQDPNIPVGVMPAWKYTTQEGSMKIGDTLFLYTDGLTEAENVNHDQFGEARMMDFLQQSDKNPRNLINHLSQSVHAFVGDADPSDDLTMMAVQFIHPIRNEHHGEYASNRRCLTLHNDVQEVPRLASFIDEVSTALGIDPSTTMTLNLAMEEAVVNVMKYAYPEGTQGEVDIAAEKSKGKLVFTITDDGVPFDPTTRENPDLTLSAEDRPIGGLGIMLVRQLMDDVIYERKNEKNILILKKNI